MVIKYYLADIEKICSDKKGVCLSKEFPRSMKIKMNFKCGEGHVWSTSGYSILRGRWCPTCAHKSWGVLLAKKKVAHTYAKGETLEKLKAAVHSKKGTLLSKGYKYKEKVEIKCAEGHIWKANTVGVIYSNSWCPVCANAAKRKHSLKDIERICGERGGECLSKEFLRKTSEKMDFKCAEGHTWSTSGYSILRGRWCPNCCKGIREDLCRKIIEKITAHKFPTLRPSWLKGLELDGYCKKLRLAFEHQGEQHYCEKRHVYSNSSDTFEKRLERDKLKKSLCFENNIILIEIPYDVPDNSLSDYIYKKIECIDGSLIVNLAPDVRDLGVRTNRMFDKVKAIAKEKGGVCLSETYLNRNSLLKFKCSEGHIWDASTLSVYNQKNWCPYCAKCKSIVVEKGTFNKKYFSIAECTRELSLNKS